MQKQFEKIYREHIKQTIYILQRLIEQRNDVDPDGYLNLDMIY
ncbi:MAG: hypothetical protein SAK29_37365 [Scytonema sp. PMC 1069.18]|nr:hypothetical protein [Scytonema sp. PMC 1069.18]MEC4883975.1 hypothetical protein [Scytonema sp. PMC 1070.18]